MTTRDSAIAPETKHPGKTAAQRRALDQIGCGNYAPLMAKSTRDAMLRAGLIQEIEPKMLGVDRLGVITIRQFQMPIPVHMQWCSAVACSEEELADLEELERAK